MFFKDFDGLKSVPETQKFSNSVELVTSIFHHPVGIKI